MFLFLLAEMIFKSICVIFLFIPMYHSLKWVWQRPFFFSHIIRYPMIPVIHFVLFDSVCAKTANEGVPTEKYYG